jgi:YidC/Oxa1 family membrane protein insertase
MDRNTIIGIVLIFVILVTFAIISRPTKQQQEAAQRIQDSIMLVHQREAANAANAQKQVSSDSTIAKGTVVPKAVETAKLKDEFGNFSSAVEGKQEFYTIENKLIKLTLTNKGGRPYSVELKKYHRADSLPLVLFNGDSSQFSLDFFSQNRRISTQDLYFSPKDSTKLQVVNDSSLSFTMRLSLTGGKYIDYIYTVRKDDYMVGLKIAMNGMDSLIAGNTNQIDLSWQIYSPQQEKGRENENTYTTLYYKFFEGEVETFSPRNNKSNTKLDVPNKLKWVAFKQQFFSSVLIANGNFAGGSVESLAIDAPSKNMRKFSTVVGLPYESKPQQNFDLSFYFGPNHFNTLKKYNLSLEELVTVGKWIVKWINQYAIIPIFNFLNRFISSYGLIILILTLIIKIALLPLTYRSYLSMAKMRVLKPQIDEINGKFPKDKAMEKQQALMGLYKKAGMNPMGGCLPLLLQMPILFAMFRFFPTSIELRQQPFLWATDLSTYDSIYSWTVNIPILSTFYGNHISLWTILMTITTILSIKMNDQTAASSAQMPGMKTMMYIMPVMFMFILNKFSSALTYYYFLTNVVTFGQNWLFKNMINEQALLKQINDAKKKPVKKSKWQERLEQAAKQRGIAPKK